VQWREQFLAKKKTALEARAALEVSKLAKNWAECQRLSDVVQDVEAELEELRNKLRPPENQNKPPPKLFRAAVATFVWHESDFNFNGKSVATTTPEEFARLLREEYAARGLKVVNSFGAKELNEDKINCHLHGGILLDDRATGTTHESVLKQLKRKGLGGLGAMTVLGAHGAFWQKYEYVFLDNANKVTDSAPYLEDENLPPKLAAKKNKQSVAFDDSLMIKFFREDWPLELQQMTGAGVIEVVNNKDYKQKCPETWLKLQGWAIR
jgi:hypothetical protein